MSSISGCTEQLSPAESFGVSAQALGPLGSGGFQRAPGLLAYLAEQPWSRIRSGPCSRKRNKSRPEGIRTLVRVGVLLGYAVHVGKENMIRSSRGPWKTGASQTGKGNIYETWLTIEGEQQKSFFSSSVVGFQPLNNNKQTCKHRWPFGKIDGLVNGINHLTGAIYLQPN